MPVMDALRTGNEGRAWEIPAFLADDSGLQKYRKLGTMLVFVCGEKVEANSYFSFLERF